MTKKATKTAEAKARSLRTLAQGAIVTAAIAVAGVVASVVGAWGPDQVLAPQAWVALGTSAIVAVLTSVASYLAAHLTPPK